MVKNVVRNNGIQLLWQHAKVDVYLLNIFKHSGWLLSGNLLVTVIGLASQIVLTRSLGAQKYGILVLVITSATTINMFLSSRTFEVGIKFITKFKEENAEEKAAAVFKLCLLIDIATAVTAYLILVVSANHVAEMLIKDSTMAGIIPLYGLILLTQFPIGISSAVLRIYNRFDWIAYHGVAVATLRLGGIFAVWHAGAGLKGVILVYVGANFIEALSIFLLARKTGDERLTKKWHRSSLGTLRGHLSEIGRFLISTNGRALFKLFQRNADILFIGYWLAPTAVSYFKVARVLADMILFPLNPLFTVSYPMFAQMIHKGKTDKLKELFKKLTLFGIAVGLIAILLLSVAGGYLIQWFFGESFMPSLPALRLLSVGVGIAGISMFMDPFLLAAGRADILFSASGLGVLMQIGFLLLLVPVWGISGAGVAYVVFYMVWALTAYYGCRTIWRF